MPLPTEGNAVTSQKTAEFGSDASSVKPIDSHARFIVVGVIVVGSFIALLNQTVMSPALPALMRDFNITTGTVQWVTSVYMLVSGIMVPISGYLIDKFSTRKLFAGALATFMVGTLLCAVAPNFMLLLGGRILQSAGSGVLLPLVAVVPMLVYPPDKRGTAMGMAGIVMAAGPAIGPVVGGLVIDSFGWRPMFIGIAVVALVILVGGTMMLKNVSELKNPKLNILSVILSTIAFGGLLYGFSSASTMGWASPVVITSIVVGLVAFVAFVYKQVKLDEPLLRVDTLATRNFRNSAILVTLINAAVAATNVTLPIFIQNVLGQSATVTGMVMLPAAAIGIILSPVAGAAFDKFGPRGVGIGGLALMTISLGLLGTINTRTSVLFVAVFCALQASGQAIANMPINTWGVNALPNDMIAPAVVRTGGLLVLAAGVSRRAQRAEAVVGRYAGLAGLRALQGEADGHFLRLLDAAGRRFADHQRLRRQLHSEFRLDAAVCRFGHREALGDPALAVADVRNALHSADSFLPPAFRH